MHWITLLPFLLLSLNVNAFAFINHFLPSTAFLSGLLKDIQLTNCGTTKLALPSSKLPNPSSGLKLQHVTLGRGTQNYTCEASNEATTPVAIGATATLFDASCIATLDQSVLHTLPDLLRRVPLSGGDMVAQLVNRFMGQGIIVGKHYFTAQGDPFFDLRTSGSKNSWIRAKKDASADAPAQPGYGITGDVAWLKLDALEGGIKEVYRVQTSGGNPPTTCQGMPNAFTVDYMAEYWFYA